MAAGQIGFHQVDAGQVLVGGVDALQALAGDAHEPGQAGAGGDVDGLKAVLAHELVDGQHLADDHVGLDVHAQSAQAVDLGLDDVLGQTELGDAVHEDAACHVQRLKDGDLVAQLGQVSGGGQAGGACTDDRHLVAVGGRRGDGGMYVFPVPVGHEALQAADAHRLTLDAADTLALALVFLGADAAADGGQGTGSGQYLIGSLKVALGHLCDETGDVDVHGAAGTAGMVLALEAALCLIDGHVGGVAQSNFLEVLVADVGLLAGHGALFGVHIGHVTRPPS